MSVDRCSKPIKKPGILKISWLFHGNLRGLKIAELKEGNMLMVKN